MNNQQQTFYDPTNGFTYIMQGGYALPDLGIPDSDRVSLGKYGMLRMEYLQNHRPILFNQLLLSGKLYPHLSEIDRECREQLDLIIPQMAKAEGVNEALKHKDPLGWAARMNSIKSRVEEVLCSERIYV